MVVFAQTKCAIGISSFAAWQITVSCEQSMGNILDVIEPLEFIISIDKVEAA